jgi:DNA invertase Pin-like site-specific DNA recombinase
MEKDVKVFAIKEGYELGNNINSKVLAFAFSLSAEIERNLISQRTKEALARKKSEGRSQVPYWA